MYAIYSSAGAVSALVCASIAQRHFVQSLAFGRLRLPIPQHGVRGRRRVDCKGRMVMRPSDLEIASQSAFRNSSVPLNSQQPVTPERAKADQPSHFCDSGLLIGKSSRLNLYRASHAPKFPLAAVFS
jgi:hypothetical protein